MTGIPLVPRDDPALLSIPPLPPSDEEWEVLEGLARTLTATGHYRVVRRFQRRERYANINGAPIKVGLYVDVETTGLDVELDRIIEFAAVPFEFDADGVVYGIGEPLTFLEDPDRPIPPEITALTGISDEMVHGQRISDDSVLHLLATSVLVLAHNAEFDRKMIERRLPAFANAYWACSQRDVPWARFGCNGAKLEYLLFRACGEFHDGHRATDDCLAAIHLLAQARCDGHSALSFLLDAARQPTVRLWAVGAPYELKDHLKARRYRWFPGDSRRQKCWFRDLTRSEVQSEELWLLDNIYKGIESPPWTREEFNARDRYSARM